MWDKVVLDRLHQGRGRTPGSFSIQINLPNSTMIIPNQTLKKVSFALLASAVGSIALVSTALHAKAQSLPREIDIAARVHVRELNNLSSPDSDGWYGTKGQGLRMELFQLGMVNPPEGLDIQYMCHLRDFGDYPAENAWLDGAEIRSRSDELAGQSCGTTSQRRRMEGFAVRLIGENARFYNVRYSCHIRGIGDMDRENGAYCGTRNQGRRMEAIRVSITHIDEG